MTEMDEIIPYHECAEDDGYPQIDIPDTNDATRPHTSRDQRALEKHRRKMEREKMHLDHANTDGYAKVSAKHFTLCTFAFLGIVFVADIVLHLKLGESVSSVSSMIEFGKTVATMTLGFMFARSSK